MFIGVAGGQQPAWGGTEKSTLFLYKHVVDYKILDYFST